MEERTQEGPMLQSPRGRAEEATQLTQGTFDPRRSGKSYTTLSPADIADIICILHPCSPAAYDITNRTAARRPQHVLQSESGNDDDALFDGMNMDEQTTFVLPQNKPSRTLDLALRFSSRTQNPGLGFLFGRSPNDCDFILDTDTIRRVSNIHFRIYVNTSGVPLLQDVSTNGTLLDDLHLVGKTSGGPQTRMLLGGNIIQILSSKPDEIIKFVVKIPNRSGVEDQYSTRLRHYVEAMTLARSLPGVQPVVRKMALPIDRPSRGQPQSGIHKEPAMHWDGRPTYNVLNQIGKGAFAIVYRIATAAEGHYYAAKELEKRRFMKNGVLDRKLDNEMQIMKDLTHPNIVQFIDYHDHKNHLYIIMEYVPCGDLQQYISQRGPLPEQMAKSMAIQVFSALSYLHKKKITHRDIKPDNILIADLDPDNFWIKLSDFGLSKVVRDEDTFMKTFCGTLLYCAPEVFPHFDNYTAAHGGNKRARQPGDRKVYHSYSQSVDIWSFGAVLWYALCGQTPFEGIMDATGRGMFERIMKTPLNPFPLLSRGISPQAVNLLLQMLQTDPASRPSPAACLRHIWFADMISQVESFNDQSEAGLNSIIEEDIEDDEDEDPVDLSQLQIKDKNSFLGQEVSFDSSELDFLDPRQSKRMKMQENSPRNVQDQGHVARNARLFGEVTSSMLGQGAPETGITGREQTTNQELGHLPERDGSEHKDHPRPDSFTTGNDDLSLSGADSMVGHLAMDSPQSSRSLLLDKNEPHTPSGSQYSVRGGSVSQETPRNDDITPKAKPFSRQIDLPVTAPFFYDPHDPSTHNPEYASRVSGHDFVTHPSAPASTFNSCLQTSLLAAQQFPDRTQGADDNNDDSHSGMNQAPGSRSLAPAADFAKPAPRFGRLVSTSDSFTDIEIPLNQRLVHWGRAFNNTFRYPDPTEPRVPRRGLIVSFEATGIEVAEKAGQGWTNLPDLHCLVATEANAGIFVNGVKMGPRTDSSKHSGRIYHGDTIIVAQGKGGASKVGQRGSGLKFKVEIWHGQGKEKRTEKFKVENER